MIIRAYEEERSGEGGGGRGRQQGGVGGEHSSKGDKESKSPEVIEMVGL